MKLFEMDSYSIWKPKNDKSWSWHDFSLFQVLEVTLLIASYINAVVQKQGLNLDASQDAFAIRGERFSSGSNVAQHSEIHLWDMESKGWALIFPF